MKKLHSSHTDKLLAVSFMILLAVTVAFVLVIMSFNRIDMFMEKDVKQNISVIVNNADLKRSLASLEIDIHGLLKDYLRRAEILEKKGGQISADLEEIRAKLAKNTPLEGERKTLAVFNSFQFALKDILKNLNEISDNLVELDKFNQSFVSNLGQIEKNAGELIVADALAGKNTDGLQQIYSLTPFCYEQLYRTIIITDSSIVNINPTLLGVDGQGGDVEQKTVASSLSNLEYTLRTMTSAEEQIAEHAKKMLALMPQYMAAVNQLSKNLHVLATSKEKFDVEWKAVNETLYQIESQTAMAMNSITVNTTGLLKKTTKIVYSISFIVLAISLIAWFLIRRIVLQVESIQNALHKSRNELEHRVETRTVQLRKSKEEWENTFDAMSDIITIQDKDMRIVRANKAFHDIFQVELGALNGKHCYEVFRGANQPCPNCPELLTLGEGRVQSAQVTHENLGKIFHVTSSPVLDENGEFAHVVHIAKDITDQKKMEEELFQAHKMEAIGTLAGGIAHDFNNILTSIIGYADIAKLDTPEGSPCRDCIDQVLSAGYRAKELVKQILTFSRKGQETNQPLQPSLIVKEGLKLMRASLPSTVEIQEEVDSDCGTIMANPTNVHQVLVNLCTNALHAMAKEKGVLTVKLNRVEIDEDDAVGEAGMSAGSFVELLVSDTGLGMDRKVLERVFEPYYTTKEVGKGSGMGLALVHGIVEGSGGFIKVESEPGEGTTFHVYFPAIEEETVIVEEEKQEQLPRGDERILVVDDEETIINMFRSTLERQGYKVTAHCSSKKTLEVFQMAPDNFDLIITDQTMPHLAGLELAKKILEIRPDIPIILCTGYSSMISEKKAEEVGIARFIMKPVSIRELTVTVREVLDNKKSETI